MNFNENNTTYKVEHLANPGEKSKKIDVPRSHRLIKIVTKDITDPPPQPKDNNYSFEYIIENCIIILANLSAKINNLSPTVPSVPSVPSDPELIRKHTELKEIIKKIIN